LEGGPTIPHGSPSPHHYHIDTCYLRPILLQRDDDADLLRAARRLVNRADGRGVCASVGALGEAILKADADPAEGRLTGEDLELMGRNLARLLGRGRVSLCALGPAGGSEEFFAQALRIRLADTVIGGIDVLILASAFCCPDCELLYTNDGPMLTSTSLKALADEAEVSIQEAPGDQGPSRRRHR
jgi:hypothetical protein